MLSVSDGVRSLALHTITSCKSRDPGTRRHERLSNRGDWENGYIPPSPLPLGQVSLLAQQEKYWRRFSKMFPVFREITMSLTTVNTVEPP